MKLISSSTIFEKRFFPVFWVGFVAYWLWKVAVLTLHGVASGHSLASQLVMAAPIMLALAVPTIVFLLVHYKWTSRLMDEVRDCGDFLLVRRGTVEDRIALADVASVKVNRWTGIPRMSLRLAKPCVFGDEVMCIVPERWLTLRPFALHPIAEDLIQRGDRARQEG